jgi:PAS domain S-box-containing protein
MAWRFREVLARPVRAAFEGAVALASDPVFVVGLDGRIICWNAAAERLYGYSAEEMVGAPIARLAPPGRLDDLIAALDRHLRGLPPAPFDAVRRDKQGRSRHVAVRLAALRDRAGRLIAIAALHSERPPLPPTPADAAEEDRNLRDLFEHASVAIHCLSRDGTILWANRAELDALGYDADEYIGHNIAQFLADPDEALAILARLAAGESARNVEVRLRAKDGSVRTMLVNSDIRWDNGQFVHTRCVSIDITDRKEAEQALRETEQRFRTLADSAPLLIWMAGPDGKTVFFNRRWLEFTGRSLEATLGDGWILDVHPEDRPRVLDQYRDALERHAPFRLEYRLRRHDGVYRWVLDNGAPIIGAGGEFAGFIGSAVDITEMREAAEERELVAAREARIEGVLLTAREMSHLLNNSITGAIGSLELLAHNPTHEGYQALIPGALAGLENAARYLRELQNIVRVETKQTPVGEALDLGRSTA